MVDLVLDLEIAERTFQAAASCSCPEPQEGFNHDDENFIAEFTFPCENSPCIAGSVTTAEFAHEAPSLSVSADGNGIVVTKAWSSFTTSETILSDMGTLYILKVAILLDFLTYFFSFNSPTLDLRGPHRSTTSSPSRQNRPNGQNGEIGENAFCLNTHLANSTELELEHAFAKIRLLKF